MATFQTKPNGRVRAWVRLRGVSESEYFDTITEAREWATRTEADIISEAKGEIPNKHFRDAIERYMREVTPTKKGTRSELARLDKTLRDPLASVHLRDLGTKHVAEWRDRLKAEGLAPSTVHREWSLLGAVCSVAMTEWKWLKRNPFSKFGGVTRPRSLPAREEVLTDADWDALRRAADGDERFVSVLRMAEFAVETLMRSGEILLIGADPKLVNTDIRVAHLPDTKNGTARDVPLSPRAIELWNEAVAEARPNNVWGFDAQSRDSAWRQLRERAELYYPRVSRLHFHDTRHTGITKLAQSGKLQPLELAMMSGHRNLNELLTYFNPSAGDTAKKL